MYVGKCIGTLKRNMHHGEEVFEGDIDGLSLTPPNVIRGVRMGIKKAESTTAGYCNYYEPAREVEIVGETEKYFIVEYQEEGFWGGKKTVRMVLEKNSVETCV